MSFTVQHKEMRAEETRRPDPNTGGSEPNPRTSYRECLKNHAASIGGNVTDGCREFMPSGDEGTPDALTCAACSCHRNFHRKDHYHAVLHLAPPLPSPSLSRHRIGGGATGWGSMIADSSREELTFNAAAPHRPQKRFRSIFTAEQKEKMLEFAQKVGWRIPREDDVDLQRFCGEVGVKRQVFKVWMHNNKNISAKKTFLN